MAEDQPQKDERAAAPLDPQNPQTSNETTPIGDEVAKELNGDNTDAGELTEVLNEDEIPFTANSVKADVKTALQRETQDGKGDDDVPPSDWQGYATDDVEVQD